MESLPGDVISSIIGSKEDELWLGTNVGLVRLYVPEDLSKVNYRLYTTADGMQDNDRMACKTEEGELFWRRPWI